jgi:hypothetical protein
LFEHLNGAAAIVGFMNFITFLRQKLRDVFPVMKLVIDDKNTFGHGLPNRLSIAIPLS